MSQSVKKTHSQLLRDKMSFTCGPLYARLGRFWSHPRQDILVPSFLTLLHQIVRATIPLMDATRCEAARLAQKDPVCALLERYMEVHIEEERDHDKWFLEDLISAGFDRELILQLVPPCSVASMVGAQYYWIQHYHPVAILGYIALLEGNPPSTEHIDRLERLSGLPATLFRTYRLHGELDPTHRAEFDTMLDSLPLVDPLPSLIARSAFNTAHHLASRLKSIETELGRSVEIIEKLRA